VASVQHLKLWTKTEWLEWTAAIGGSLLLSNDDMMI
jgi:hypothetical protein